MVYRNAILVILCLILTCFRLVPACGDTSFEAARQKAAAMNPIGVSVTLTLPSGRTQFHRGEIVPLSAVFASSLPGKYDLNTDSGSRDLQWGNDSFSVDSAGAVDPLPVYYDHEFGMSYEGPGPQFQPLSAKPLTISYTLNEWLRFDAPGHYRVYLTSGRVTDATKRHESLFFSGHAATSNTAEFDILPDDPVWDAKTLQAALPLFNKSIGENDYPAQGPQTAAAHTIRFLETPDAARVMIARYGTFSEFDFLNTRAYFETDLGLLGFPQPQFVISEMEQRIAGLDFPVSERFIYDLAQIQFFAAYPQTIPRYVAGDPANEKQRQDLSRQRLAAMTALQEQDWERLKVAAPAKHGRARVASLYALLRLDYRSPNSAEHQSQVRALVPVFDNLTPEQQENLLGYQWAALRGPDILPILRRLYAAPLPNADPGSAEGSEAVERHSLALRRLTELSSAEGRALLLAEIKSTQPRVDLPTLCSLPDRTLPALDSVLAANLESILRGGNGDWRVAPRLVERYATAFILPRVKAAYGNKGGKWACDIQTSLLAYFLRTDPAYGAAQMREVLATRKDTGCYHFVLSDVAALQSGPEVERLAVRHLQDPDTAVAADAAKTLGEKGSPRSEAALWKRLRQWHAQWAGKADQIGPTDADIAPQPGQLEYALINAIATAPGWLTSQAQLQALDRLCVTQGAHGNVTSFLQDWAETIRVSCLGDAGPWSVVQYHSLPSLTSLENKLSQFPRGTRFQLSPFGFSGQAAQAQAFARLKLFLEQRGMFLKMEPFPRPQPK